MQLTSKCSGSRRRCCVHLKHRSNLAGDTGTSKKNNLLHIHTCEIHNKICLSTMIESINKWEKEIQADISLESTSATTGPDGTFTFC